MPKDKKRWKPTSSAIKKFKFILHGDFGRDLFNILLKEDFRAFLRKTDAKRDYFLDSIDFIAIPNSVGCFHNNHDWIVYETDERSIPIKQMSFSNATNAFQYAASLRELEYIPSPDVKSLEHEPITSELYLSSEKLISDALDRLTKIRKIHEITGLTDSLTKDIDTLTRALQKIDAQKSVLNSSMTSEQSEGIPGCNAGNSLKTPAIGVIQAPVCYDSVLVARTGDYVRFIRKGKYGKVKPKVFGGTVVAKKPANPAKTLIVMTTRKGSTSRRLIACNDSNTKIISIQSNTPIRPAGTTHKRLGGQEPKKQGATFKLKK